MESIIFANSPLAEYLEGNGQNEADWGIEPLADDPDTSTTSFAPSLFSSITSKFTKNGLPIQFAKPSWNAWVLEAFTRVVNSRLSRRENLRFLERFRYIIVASQLLNAHVNVSHYDRKQDIDHQLFSEDDPATMFGAQLAFAARVRNWIGGFGGVALASTLVFSWIFRGSGGNFSKGRAFVVAVVIVFIGIIILTQARSRWLRSLRSKAIEFAAVFVENSQTFDILASSAVTLIQEVELVSRGFRLSFPLPPITRLERDNKSRRCARIRKSILSALKMALPPHHRACISLRYLIQELDLEKYYEIYDIQMADLEEVELEVCIEDMGDLESLGALKILLHRLHITRRVFLCSLLALDADGRYSDYTRWGLAVEQLRSLGNLIAELAGELKKILAEEEQFPVPPTPKVPLSPESEKCRGQLRKLNSLSQSLRGLQAKMHVLREESDRTLHESPDLNGFGRDLLTHYDSIGADLRALVDEWENARAYLAMSIDKQDRTNSSGSPRDSKFEDSMDGTTLYGDTPRNSRLFDKDESSGWADAAGLGLFSSIDDVSQYESDREDVEEVYEAIAEPSPSRQRSSLSRDERIKKVQEERALRAEKSKTIETGLALQRELQSVLTNRPTKRKYTVRDFSLNLM